jgi:hypothetical protein
MILTYWVKKNKEALFEARGEVGLEVNTEKTQHMLSRYHDVGQNHISLIANKIL